MYLFQDKHVLTRHQEVYPKEEELKLILELVGHTEEALKKVSDKLFEKVRTIVVYYSITLFSTSYM